MGHGLHSPLKSALSACAPQAPVKAAEGTCLRLWARPASPPLGRCDKARLAPFDLYHYLWVIRRAGRSPPAPQLFVRQKPILRSPAPRRVFASGVIFCRDVPVFSAPDEEPRTQRSSGAE